MARVRPPRYLPKTMYRAEPVMAVVVMEWRNARFRPSRDGGGDNYELPLVRPCRIHWCSADRSRVFTSATGETPERVAEIFATERSRSTVDNRLAHLRLQFVSVYRGSVLVFDQRARFMAIAHFPEKFPAKHWD
jgi:hypothetical protein